MAQVNASPAGDNYFDGMEKLGKSHKHFLWIAAICYFFDQMDMQMFGNITPAVMEDLGFTLEQISVMNSLNFLGMCLGGFLGGWIATKIGRKNTLVLLVGIFSIASIVNALSGHYINFLVCRFLIGFGTIGMVTVSMVYMAEMLPSHNRGKYQALSIAAGTLGIPFGAFFCAAMVGIGAHTWRLCFLIGGIGIVLVPLGMKWLKESPRWLVMKGKISDAEKIVSECTGKPCDLSELAFKCVQPKTIGMLGSLKIMFSKSFFRQTIVVIVLAWGATLGIFYMSNYGTTFNVDMGLQYQLVLLIAATGVIGTPLGDLTVSAFSDKGGRRIPIIIFSCIAGALCILRGFTTQPIINYINSGGFALGLAALVAMGVLFSLFGGGTMTMMWTYLAESFPTKIRSNATGMVFGSARLVASFMTLTVPSVYAVSGYLGINIVNGLWYFIPAFFGLIWGVSSAGKSLEELEAEAERLQC